MNVQAVYDGSDGEATKALYAQLAGHGPRGELATNLFRAQKSSTRAKVYRGGIRGQGSFKSMAYGRKDWALANLCAVLHQHAHAVGIAYGWQRDERTPGYEWVLYIDLETGQVSFHMPARGVGPDYTGTWDGIRGVSADRIVRWCQQILDGPNAPALAAPATGVRRWLWCRICAAFWANQARCPVHQTERLVVKDDPVIQPELRPGVHTQWDEGSAS